MAVYVYEFLYRGRPNGESAYHVVLADVVADALGQSRHVESSVLTPEQATTLGFPLTTIIAEINATVLIERDRALAEKAALEMERDRVITEKDTAIRERDAAVAELTRVVKSTPGGR